MQVLQDRPAGLAGWGYGVLSGMSQTLNALTWGNNRQTLSSRSYEEAVVKQRWPWMPLYWLLDNTVGRILREPDHCRDAYATTPYRTYPGSAAS